MAPETHESTSSQRILVVDDDRSSCEIVSKILSHRGYQVDVAYDGKAALDLVGQQDYGLALIDYRMPKMDGIELYRKIHEMRPTLVGLFVTGYPTIETIYPAIAAGVERVIAKPASSDQLLGAVEQYVGKPQ
jgi:CheY-like chemotaxis protein